MCRPALRPPSDQICSSNHGSGATSCSHGPGVCCAFMSILRPRVVDRRPPLPDKVRPRRHAGGALTVSVAGWKAAQRLVGCAERADGFHNIVALFASVLIYRRMATLPIFSKPLVFLVQ